MKHHFKRFGFYFAEYAVCFILSALISSPFAILIRFIWKDDLLGQRIGFTVCDLVCIFGFLFVSTAIEGYKTRKFEPVSIVCCFAILMVIQHAVALYTNFAYTLCGPTGFLCEAIYFGDLPAIGENEFRINWFPFWWETLCLLAFQIFVYLPAIILGEKFGVSFRKRRYDRL